MGCDIHVVIEKKFGDKWIGMELCRSISHYPFDSEKGELADKPGYIWHPARSRNYELFAKLAGVRGDGPDPKGLPEDASELSHAVLPADDSDLHSHSWCSMEEYIRLLLETESNPAKVLLTDSVQLKDPYRYYFWMYAPEEGEEYRCVFAFDN